jgi:predicted Zn-dependent protease
LANALFHQNRHKDALEAVKRCLNQMPNSPYCLRIQIAILARLGRIEDAEWAVEEYAMLGQDLSLASIMEGAIERDASMRAHLLQSYKLVGLE